MVIHDIEFKCDIKIRKSDISSLRNHFSEYYVILKDMQAIQISKEQYEVLNEQMARKNNSKFNA